MALFGRKRLPSRSTLSRFLAALTPAPVEALRALFLADLLARPLSKDRQTGELVDRSGGSWLAFDIDGTREAARQRALPQGEHLPEPQRRLQHICAPGYPGRKRGEVIRTRTAVRQAHSYQWLGSFGNPGNGHFHEELRRAIEAIQQYLEAHHVPQERALLRLDGQYGTGAVLSGLAGYCFVTRGKAYAVLDHSQVQTRLHLPSDQLGALMDQLCGADQTTRQRIEIVNVHSLATSLLRRAGGSFILLDDALGQRLMSEAIRSQDTLGLSPAFYLAEWNEVVQERDVLTEEAYVQVDRASRGKALTRKQRAP